MSPFTATSRILSQLGRRFTADLAPFTRAGLPVAGLLVALLLPLPSYGATLPTGFSEETLATNVDTPVGLAFLPDGRLLVVEQFSGRIAVLPSGAGSVTSLFTISDINPGGEGGLLGIAVDPAWPARPYLYVVFNHPSSTIHVRMYTVTGDLSDPGSTSLSLGSPYEILDDIPDIFFNHNGGTLRFGPDGMLYLSTGDDAQFCLAQDLDELAGKILRLDVSALPLAGSGPPAKSEITPADNPFAGPSDNARLVYCYGLRNPFRFHIDRSSGRLYIGDVGSGSYEEVDEASGGENFGWPHREGAHDHPSGQSCPGNDGLDPIWEYDRSGFGASIIGDPLYRIGGTLSFPAEYEGDLFFHDYYQGWLRRLTFDGASWSIASPVPGQPAADNWAEGFSGVPEILLGPDGALYFVTQFDGGTIRRVGFPSATSAPETPLSFELGMRVHPNPVVTGTPTRLSFHTERSGTWSLTVHDVLGRRRAATQLQITSAGSHELDITKTLQALDGEPGLYVFRLEGYGYSLAQKVLLTR